MTLWIMTNILIGLTSSILMAPSPFTMGMIILMIAVSVASFYAASLSSWFAFLVFLIYVGGMLIMFAYFLALTPNQSSIYTPNILIPLMATILILPLTMIFTDSWSELTISMSPQVELLFLPNNIMVLLMLTIILLVTMIIVVKTASWNKGPLRAFMAYV